MMDPMAVAHTILHHLIRLVEHLLLHISMLISFFSPHRSYFRLDPKLVEIPGTFELIFQLHVMHVV